MRKKIVGMLVCMLFVTPIILPVARIIKTGKSEVQDYDILVENKLKKDETKKICIDTMDAPNITYKGIRFNMATNYYLVLRKPIFFLFWIDFISINYIESLNANTVSILLGYIVSNNGDIRQMPFSSALASSHIQKCHDAGLNVAVVPIFVNKNFFFGPLNDAIMQNDNFLVNLEDATLNAAQFAEEHNAEIFFASNELELVLGWEKALNFSKNILPGVKAIYTGKVGWHSWLRGLVDMETYNDNGIVQLKVPIDAFNFSGYDLYGMTTDMGANIKDSAENFAEGFITLGETISEQSNTSFILPEIFGLTLNMMELTHLYFEKGKGKAIGYFPTYTVWKKSFFEDFIKQFYIEN